MARDKEPRHYEVLPSPETPVWRYLSLPKFLALLRTQAVFLCRADLFEDVFEGAFTEGSLREHAEEWGTELPEDLVTLARWVPCRSYVSCWHASEVESAALWKIYAASEGALAVRSTVGALQQVFPATLKSQDNLILNQDLRRVQYIDYRTEHPDINDLAGPLCYKRRAFAFEQEVRVIRQELPTGPAKDRPNGRVIVMGPPPDETGREVPVDLETLIGAIYLAPSSPPWLLPTLRETMRRFGFGEIDCRQSSLDELPDFGRLGD
jgi:hypothetical protein